jgi:hypothetical protein
VDCLFSVVGQALEDAPASGIGEGFEDCFYGGWLRAWHSKTITVWLLIVKPLFDDTSTSAQKGYLF